MMAVHIGLDVERRKPGKRLNFQPVIGNADVIEISPGRAMKTLAAGNYHIKFRQGLFKRNSLADMAAGVGIALVQQAGGIISENIKCLRLNRAQLRRVARAVLEMDTFVSLSSTISLSR